ncbi:hypothetical protein ACFU9X_24345 [Streptomyces atratus]|uniref:hypothetical protein n=1 Tax=Streptomyces atratus TaxID=1893 RepID=UPI003686091E
MGLSKVKVRAKSSRVRLPWSGRRSRRQPWKRSGGRTAGAEADAQSERQADLGVEEVDSVGELDQLRGERARQADGAFAEGQPVLFGVHLQMEEAVRCLQGLEHPFGEVLRLFEQVGV